MMALAQAYVLASLFTCIVGDFQCICNYISALPVYSQAKQSPQIGTLGEFECKSEVRVQIQDWYRIALNHRYGFVESTTGMVLQQTCPGSPSKDDIVTSGATNLTTATFTSITSTTAAATPTKTVQTTPTTAISTTEAKVSSSATSNTVSVVQTCDQKYAMWSREKAGRYLAVHGNKCYALDTSIMLEFDYIPGLCVGYQGSMVTISNVAEQTFIESFVKQTINRPVWIGCNAAGAAFRGYHWTVSSRTFTNWSPTTPHGTQVIHGYNDCALLDPGNGGKWNLSACYTPYHAMCQYPTVGQNFLPTMIRPTPAAISTPSTTHMTTRKASPGTPMHTTPFNLLGSLFGIIGGTVSSSIGDLSRCPPALQAWEAQARSHLLAQWGASCYTLDTNNRQSLNNADTLCHVVSSHVVDIQTRQEQDFLQGFLKLKGFHEKVWTGYTDRLVENHFTWTTGANASFNNFKPGEKTTLLHNNLDCTVINPNNHGLWETRPCYEIYTFFCEYGTII